MEYGKALVIEDDRTIRRELVELLDALKLTVDEASSLEEANSLTNDGTYRLVLVDLRLPDGSGFDALARFQRCVTPPVVVVVSSAMDVTARSRSIELGARDFISKPFHHDEVIRRLRRALQRGAHRPSPSPAARRLTVGPVALDCSELRVRNGPRQRRLSEAEARLLELIMRRPGRAVAVEELAERLWPGDHRGPRRVRKLLRRLVAKVETDRRSPVWVRQPERDLVRFAAPAEAGSCDG
jgi:DNA-binding response OmpR family regulator